MAGNPTFSDDDVTHYTNVGNIGLTITNFGTLGNGFALWPQEPSCEYPKGSGIEHLFESGLWVGGIKDGIERVTTGAIDVSSAVRGEGFEWTNAAGQLITQRSSLTYSPYYNPQAISHQDFICEYLDTNTFVNGQLIPNHHPMGLKVIQQSYCWNYSYADFFVIIRYKIINIGYRGDITPIDSIFVGLWNDVVVRNTHVTPPGGTSFFTHGARGWDSTYNMGYGFDYNGDVGFTNSYIGVKFLGSTPVGRTISDTIPVPKHFVSWQFRNTNDPLLFEPQTDEDSPSQLGRYGKMNGYFTFGVQLNPSIRAILKQPSDRSIMVTAGPYRTLNYLDTLEVVFGMICANKTGNDPQQWDSTYQRTDLHSHADWCQRAYDNHYALPSPPDMPILRVVNQNQNVTLYWAANSTFSVDPISHQRNFEGYRIYRTNTGADIFNPAVPLLSNFILAADFDSIDNQGNNTGFRYIQLNQPMMFPSDTNHYWFRFSFPNLLNGWQYAFSVTAYSKYDSVNQISSLESSLLANAKRVLPGTMPANNESTPIGVYPNPYYGHALWDGNTERERKIYFYNLPDQCEITIYTIAGDIVAQLTHNSATYNGSDIKWFQTYADGTQVFSGGEHAWDLITRYDQAIATGLYLFTVKNTKTGFIKKGKFLVIK